MVLAKFSNCTTADDSLVVLEGVFGGRFMTRTLA
jgi:hypothetical protein